ncbi:MAG: hypothetical protein LIP77_03530 [Planctomycetes bacterium]|nr:hypothetical protein [Planctomycetota bacterium]
MPSFTRKILAAQLEFVTASKTITGLGISATVTKPGPPQLPTAKVNIFGCSMQDLEAFTTVSFEAQQFEENRITLLAGEEGGSMNVVFMGEVASSFANFNLAPDPVLQIDASAGFFPARIIGTPESQQEPAAVCDLCQKWANQAGYNFLGMKLNLPVAAGTVVSGSPIDKITKTCEDVGVTAIVDDGTIIILGKDEKRDGPIPLISRENGLINYPDFTSKGIKFTTLYRPDILLCGMVKVESIVPKASGEWQVTSMKHTLSTQSLGGSNAAGTWVTEVEATKLS